MSTSIEALIKYGLQIVLALVLIVMMGWIIVSPSTTDEISKAALVVVSSTAGFLLGKSTT